MHNITHNVPVLNSPSSIVYNQFGSYGATYNQVCQVYMFKNIYDISYFIDDKI